MNKTFRYMMLITLTRLQQIRMGELSTYRPETNLFGEYDPKRLRTVLVHIIRKSIRDVRSGGEFIRSMKDGEGDLVVKLRYLLQYHIEDMRRVQPPTPASEYQLQLAQKRLEEVGGPDESFVVPEVIAEKHNFLPWESLLQQITYQLENNQVEAVGRPFLENYRNKLQRQIEELKARAKPAS